MKMRLFLLRYEECLSLAKAARAIKISPRLPYIWKHRKDRTGRWFTKALERAVEHGIERPGAGVRLRPGPEVRDSHLQHPEGARSVVHAAAEGRQSSAHA
jgi:hypothetical protein